VVWDKPNGLPESVTDRVRRSHEQWFHFVKEPRYFAAVDEIREHFIGDGSGATKEDRKDTPAWNKNLQDGQRAEGMNVTFAGHPLGRLPGSVWTIPTEPLLIPDDTRQALNLPDHFAAFPQEWPSRIIIGWSPVGGIVLDPLAGTGTVAGVAKTLGRYGISNDLSASYNRLAIWRINDSGHFSKTEQKTWAARQGTMNL
jgi:site-specific DNA-methyltransferase (cytosine-N4-specific)